MIEYQKVITAFLGAAALAAAQADARAKFPNESCGFIAAGQYVACENLSKTPLTDFIITDARYDSAVKDGTLTAVVHSHPNGPIFPSAHDMMQQVATNVPWAIISLNSNTIGHTVVWGDQIQKAPLLGRPFVHGVFDCYSLIRDVYALGSDALAAQGITWPLPPIKLDEFPRDDNWWQSGKDLYTANIVSQGFTKISRSEVQPGDVFLIALGGQSHNPKKLMNHGGVLIGKNHILHHLPGRNSRREPAGLWARAADVWFHYTATTK